ncbi:hypothetical protein [Aliamphritea spongicola]|nr:hypothetical protein [Aliamphritea spongicola]
MKNIITFVFLLISFPAIAHTTEEIIKLKAANDALVLRVAELLEENKNLKEFAKKALISQSQGKKYVQAVIHKSFEKY